MTAPSVRSAAVGGRFYPADPTTLRNVLHTYMDDPAAPRQPAIGVVVPHAGYIYSGRVAGAVYARIEPPARAIILCPNHTGRGVPLAIMRSGAWQTPLGELPIDTEMSDALLAADPELEDDIHAHRHEHAIEVQLPFLQHARAAAVRFTPITVGTSDWGALERLGRALAEVVAAVDRATLIIASSDMNHYESDAVTRVKDARAIDPMLNLDAQGLYETVRRERISMCGFGPASAMLIAARLLGASQAELAHYATSAEVSGDMDYVVGYAGIVVGKEAPGRSPTIVPPAPSAGGRDRGRN